MPMKRISREAYRQYVEKWREAGPELERIHREELRQRPYDPADADTLLELGDSFKESRPTTGMVEMQEWFMKLAERQGLKPRAAPRRRAVPGSERKAEE
jgi:hypothetical protein